jgi:hypothetical protein
MTWISPNYQDANFPNGLNLNQKINVFADRVTGWQLNIADQCANSLQHSGFGVLLIIMSYFEMISKFKYGFVQNGKSKAFFKKGIFDVFPDLQRLPQNQHDNIINKLYEDVRCGLYHGGTTGPSIILTGNTDSPLSGNNNQIIINPHLLVSSIQTHFRSYIDKLRDPSNAVLRNNFEARFDFR